MRYETKGGQFSRGDTYKQLSEHLIAAQELIHIIGHDYKADGDIAVADLWHKAGENIKRMQELVRSLATGATKIGTGYRQ
jgi:hypothetical protein